MDGSRVVFFLMFQAFTGSGRDKMYVRIVTLYMNK
jgi:hypothetical protein